MVKLSVHPSIHPRVVRSQDDESLSTPTCGLERLEVQEADVRHRHVREEEGRGAHHLGDGQDAGQVEALHHGDGRGTALPLLMLMMGLGDCGGSCGAAVGV
jgi:hypothetical protein